MKFNRKNIIFIFLVVGILSLTLNNNSAIEKFVVEDISIENDSDEEFNEIESSYILKDSKKLKTSGGNFAIFTDDCLSFRTIFSTSIPNFELFYITQKIPFYILYCRLIIDFLAV